MDPLGTFRENSQPVWTAIMSGTRQKYVPGQHQPGRSTSRDMLNFGILGGGLAEDLLVSAIMVVDGTAHPRRTQMALQSLTPQTYDGWECIVVRNGPILEDTQETLEECVTLDDRIRIISLPEPVSETIARNQGIQHARAPFIANLSPNAISEPDRFLNQLLAFQDHPGIAVCGTWVRLLDEETHITGVRRYPAETDAIARIFCLENPTCEASLMFRREVAAYPEKYFHGACYFHLVRLVMEGKPVINVPQFLVASYEPERPACKKGWRAMREHMAARRLAVRLLPAWKRPLVMPFIWLLPVSCCMPLGLWRAVRKIQNQLLG